MTFALLLERGLRRIASDGDTAENIKAILAIYAEPSSGESFWMGDGDDLWGALADNGWSTWRFDAAYYWVMTKIQPDGTREFVAYTEGDISYSDNPNCAKTVEELKAEWTGSS